MSDPRLKNQPVPDQPVMTPPVNIEPQIQAQPEMPPSSQPIIQSQPSLKQEPGQIENEEQLDNYDNSQMVDFSHQDIKIEQATVHQSVMQASTINSQPPILPQNVPEQNNANGSNNVNANMLSGVKRKREKQGNSNDHNRKRNNNANQMSENMNNKEEQLINGC